MYPLDGTWEGMGPGFVGLGFKIVLEMTEEFYKVWIEKEAVSLKEAVQVEKKQ